MSEVTLDQLNQMCEVAFQQRELVDLMKSNVSAEQAKLDSMEMHILEALERSNLKSYKSPHGAVEMRSRMSVRIPKGDDRDRFFDYLKGRGIFEHLVSVNSQTLNAWFKAEQEKANENQEMLVVPGLEAPSATKILAMKKVK